MSDQQKKKNVGRLERDSTHQTVNTKNVSKRRMSEKMLRESLTRFKALVETTSDFIWEMNAEGVYTYCSPQAEKIWGFQSEDLIGKTVFEGMTSEDRESALKMFSTYKESPRSVNRMEINSHDSRGKPVTLEISAVPFLGSDGKLLGYRGISRDITEKKLVENALRKSEEKYRILVENAAEAVIVVQEGKIKFFNHKAGEITGCSREELLSKPLAELIPVDERERVSAIHQRRIQGENVPSYQIRVERKDGSIKWAEIRAVVIEWEGKPASLELIVDVTERKLAEEALKASQQKYQALVETTSDFIWETDSQGRYTYCSPQMKRLWGYDPHEMIGKTPFDNMPSEEREKVIQDFRDMTQSPRPFTGIEFDSLDSQGRLITIEVSQVPYFDNNARLSGFRGITRDITQRKQIEEALEESEEKYRSVVDNASELIVVFQEGFIKFTNNKALKVTGYTREELLSQPFTVFIHPLDRAMLIETYQKRAQGKAVPDNYEIRILHKDGSTRWVEVSAALVQWQGKPATQVLVSDITERKKAEEALRISEEKYRLLIENSSEVIVVIQDSLIKFINNQGLIPSGYSPEEVAGKPFLEFVHPDDRESISGLYRGLIRDQSAISNREFQYILKDGSTRWAILNAARIIWEEKPAILAIITDITERKRMEEALRESEAKANELIKYAPSGIYEMDFRGTRFISVNDAMCKITGYTREELLAISPTAFLDKDSLKLFYKKVRRKPAGKNVELEADLKVKKKNGSYIYVTQQSTFSLTERDIVFAIAHDITERKIMEQKLKEYALKITQVQEEERKRIAYELHDDTAQYISILKMQLNALLNSGEIQSPKILERLQFLEKDADRAFHDVRRYSHELRPVVLEHLGLRAALEQTADDINKVNSFKAEVEVEGREPELSEEIKLGFFRVAQEALNNIRKHAKATNATVSLTFQDTRLKMVVRDNGIGFDIKEAATRAGGKGSLGMMSMKERADLIGASLKIESQPRHGTTVRVEMLLPNRSEVLEKP
jgi:PAS domain S-box-containing protein